MKQYGKSQNRESRAGYLSRRWASLQALLMLVDIAKTGYRAQSFELVDTRVDEPDERDIFFLWQGFSDRPRRYSAGVLREERRRFLDRIPRGRPDRPQRTEGRARPIKQSGREARAGFFQHQSGLKRNKQAVSRQNQGTMRRSAASAWVARKTRTAPAEIAAPWGTIWLS